MSSVRDDLENFHQFAIENLSENGHQDSLEDLLIRWRAARERESVNQAIREGLADLEAGRGRPAREAMDELYRKHAIRPE